MGNKCLHRSTAFLYYSSSKLTFRTIISRSQQLVININEVSVSQIIGRHLLIAAKIRFNSVKGLIYLKYLKFMAAFLIPIIMISLWGTLCPNN